MTQPDVAMFVCTAIGRPRPSITWYMIEPDNSSTIINGAELGISITIENGDTERNITSTLVFYPTRPFFTTTYICEASNPVTSSNIATLTVFGKLS